MIEVAEVRPAVPEIVSKVRLNQIRNDHQQHLHRFSIDNPTLLVIVAAPNHHWLAGEEINNKSYNHHKSEESRV